MMKTGPSSIYRFAIAFLLWVGAVCPAWSQSAPTKLVIASDLWCPYSCPPFGGKEGFMVDVARAAFALRGVSIEYRIVPWTRAVNDARRLRVDGIIGAAKADAPDFIYPSEEQGVSGEILVYRTAENFSFTDTAALTAYKIGIIEGYTYGPEIQGYLNDNIDDPNRVYQATGNDATAKNLRLLMAKKLSLVLEDLNVAQQLIKENRFHRDLSVTHSVTAEEPIYIGFSPENPRSWVNAATLSDGMKKLRASGELAKILSRYGLKDWK